MSAVASVRHEIVVPTGVERAFALFTERFDRVKPREHNLLAVDIEETVLEPRVGGHLLDRGVDGSECRWGTVLVYDPPDRLVFSWNIGPTWEIETDPERASEVEVSFVAEGPGSTRVVLEHRHFERHGEGWEGVRAGVDDPAGWPLYLQRFADALG